MKRSNSLIDYTRAIQHFHRRYWVLIACLCLFSLLLFGRLFYLQIIHHKQYTTLSRQNFLNIIPIAPERGLIFDRNGVLLAKNIPAYNLDIIPGKVANMKETLQSLQQIMPIDQDDIRQFKRRLTQHHRYDLVPLKFKLSETEMDAFYVNAFRFPGLSIRATLLRSYSLNEAGSSVLGYVGKINDQDKPDYNNDNYSATIYIGKTGIEKSYENTLHGTVGVEQAEINASGQIIRTLGQQRPQAGENLYLTIDSRLQQYIVKQLGNLSAAVVAVDPSNGEILAMVSTPSYDPNAFSQGMSTKAYQQLIANPHHPLFNKTTRGLYSPGSTIKPFLALSALDNNIINNHSRVYDPGWFKLPNSQHVFRDWKPSGHGWVNVSQALMVSCDTFFYDLSTKMGISLIDYTLDTFGFGQITEMDVPGELPGTVPTPTWKQTHQNMPWYPGDTIITGIGQGSLLVTPIQLAMATATIAMQGQRYQPHLILGTQIDKQPITLYTPQQISTLVLNNPGHWKTIIHALQDVVRKPQGTATHFGHPPYTVAAKTGTAQIYGHHRDEKYSPTKVPWKLRNNHLFIDFAPVDHPKIALAIVIEHEGGADSIAGKITNYYMLHCLNHSPTPNKLTSPTA